jgi:hypothetical protein
VTAYTEFLARKAQLAHAGGFEPVNLPGHLFDFQTALVEWAVRQGRAGLFADCGLGKTPMELAWAEQVYLHTGKPVLLMTPLAVGFQIVAEAEKFGHDAALSRTGKVTAPITVTNYEQLDKFEWSDFGGVVCDESSAIKSFEGTRRATVTEFMRRIQYRLLGTATAAPNDYIELGTSSEALGELGYMDMLSRFFINQNKTADTKAHWRGFKAPRALEQKEWRLKGYADQPFWRWVSSWARAMRRPSDYGFDDRTMILPELIERTMVVEARESRPDMLFDMPAVGLQEEREENRRTLTERCEAAAAVLEDARPGVAWCHLNAESELLTKIIPGAVELTGSMEPDEKEEILHNFSDGKIRVLVSKPKLAAYGLNWQHCHRMAYFPSHSYEQMYQAVRRLWRFGQKNPVTVDFITTEGGRDVLANLQRKAVQADAMFSALVEHMNHARNVNPHTYTEKMELPQWLSATN